MSGFVARQDFFHLQFFCDEARLYQCVLTYPPDGSSSNRPSAHEQSYLLEGFSMQVSHQVWERSAHHFALKRPVRIRRTGFETHGARPASLVVSMRYERETGLRA